MTLAAVVRGRLGLAWNAARDVCRKGKVNIGGALALDPAVRVERGQAVTVRPDAPGDAARRRREAAARIVFEDAHVVVIDKPSGVSSVPWERGERGTAIDLVRDAWRSRGLDAARMPVHVVHRLDRATSGLLVFAKTSLAMRTLRGMLRKHDVSRVYLCIAHGRVEARTFRSSLVRDRGDGYRGSARGRKGSDDGKPSVTHVRPIEILPAATLCEVTLETGRTHQIRIHLAEAGHPVVGDDVYSRDWQRAGNEALPAGRLLLHARRLSFAHPVTGRIVDLEREPPRDFLADLERLRRAPGSPPGPPGRAEL